MRRGSILDYKVKDLMSRKPMVAAPDDEVSRVLGMMKQHDFHEVPVVKDDRLLGMVSYTTLLRRRNLPMTTKINSLLIRPPRIEEDDPLPQVAEILMSSGYRAVPVATDDRLVGLISRTDLMRAIAQSEDFSRLRVGEVMTPEPQVIGEEDTVLRARELMRELDENALPVVDDSGKLVGVVGLKDLVRALVRPRKKETRGDVVGEKTTVDLEVRGIMSVPPITITPEKSAAEAARLMERSNISSVVVVEGREPVGIVTQVDLLEGVAALRTREEAFVQISGLDEDDWWTYEMLYSVIGRGLRRIANIVRPTILNVHVLTHRTRGDRTKYSMGARLSTENGLYVARDFDWDPSLAMHKVMDQFERRIKKEKDQMVDSRKHRRSRG
ncbi:MAG: CBS domain-containing protein [Candidatus Thermoplasmatota archaeon]|nr:CBS domain-containing protein [Candidatus Thermoplasmatota archaeon]